MPNRYLRVITVCFWLLILALGVRFVRIVVRAASNPSGDFANYYTASRLLAEGADPARDYDNVWFNARAMERTPMQGAVDINPPTTDLALLPLVGLDYWWALRVWTVLKLIILAASAYFLMNRLGLRRLWALGFVALVLHDQPMHADFAKGQIYVLLLGLMTVAWHAYRNRCERTLGITLAVMLLMKLAGGLFLLMLVAQRRWRALGWAVGSIILGAILASPWLGLAAWRADFHALKTFTALGVTAYTDFQTQYGFLRRLFAIVPGINPDPLWNAPLLATVLNGLGVVAVVGCCLYAAIKARDDDPDLIFACFVSAGVALSPASLEYHYTLLLLPIALLLARGSAPDWGNAAQSRGARVRVAHCAWHVLLGIAIVLLTFRLPYTSPAISHGAWMLLAYPRLYGAYLVVGLAIYGATQRRLVSSS